MAFGTKDARGIYQFGEDDAEATFSQLLNKGMESVSDATKFFSGTPAERAALSPAPEGAYWQDTDSARRVWRSEGGAWKQLAQWAHQVAGADAADYPAPSAGTLPIMKTGYYKANLVGGWATVNFTDAFPNRCLHVSVMTIDGAVQAPAIGSRQLTKNGFVAGYSGLTNQVLTFTWMAVGY